MTTTPTPETLPGLAIDDDGTGASSPLGIAVRRTIQALHDADRIAPADAARLQLALSMANVIELKMASGRMSTIGQDARVLMDLLEALREEAGDVDDELRDAMDAWSDATNATP